MFYCDKCGYCCRSLSGVSVFQKLDRGDGVCKHFDEATNLCTIYEQRPLLCRVDESYTAYFQSLFSEEEYEKLNYAACQALKEEFNGA